MGEKIQMGVLEELEEVLMMVNEAAPSRVGLAHFHDFLVMDYVRECQLEIPVVADVDLVG